MYEAREPKTNGRRWQFRNLDALARRVTGSKDAWWSIANGDQDNPPNREVFLVRPDRRVLDAGHVDAVVLVPPEATQR